MLSCNQGPVLNLTYTVTTKKRLLFMPRHLLKTKLQDKNADILRVGINALYQLTNAMAF